MKFSNQFDLTELVKNFDIATLRIYIGNYIGRIRDWQILSKTWPSSRIDLLGCCFQIFAHIVNMLKKTSWTKIKQPQVIQEMLLILHDCVLPKTTFFTRFVIWFTHLRNQHNVSNLGTVFNTFFPSSERRFSLQNPTYLQFCDVRYDQLFPSRHL